MKFCILNFSAQNRSCWFFSRLFHSVKCAWCSTIAHRMTLWRFPSESFCACYSSILCSACFHPLTRDTRIYLHGNAWERHNSSVKIAVVILFFAFSTSLPCVCWKRFHQRSAMSTQLETRHEIFIYCSSGAIGQACIAKFPILLHCAWDCGQIIKLVQTSAGMADDKSLSMTLLVFFPPVLSRR